MRRDIVLVLTLIILLVLVFVVRPISSEWHYVVNAPAGELIYASGFDGFNDEWEEALGRKSAQITDGVMQLEVGEPNDGLFAPAFPYFTDFDLTIDAQAISGPIDNAFGVVFRLQDPRNYYVFLISSDGYYSVERAVDGDRKVISTWIQDASIGLGLDAVNTIRVLAIGDTFHFFVNDVPLHLCIPDSIEGTSTYRAGECVGGQMLDAFVDDAHDAGRVGVTALTFNAPDVIVNFDNLVIYSPDETRE